eukprot:15462218-Alexandrium_andersonii.AAC.1
MDSKEQPQHRFRVSRSERFPKQRSSICALRFGMLIKRREGATSSLQGDGRAAGNVRQLTSPRDNPT